MFTAEKSITAISIFGSQDISSKYRHEKGKMDKSIRSWTTDTSVNYSIGDCNEFNNIAKFLISYLDFQIWNGFLYMAANIVPKYCHIYHFKPSSPFTNTDPTVLF